MIWTLLIFFSGKAFAGEMPSVVYKNNEAASLFVQEKLGESKIQLEKEVVNHPSSGALHYNLGVVHENSKEPEKAIQEYHSATLLTQDDQLKFKANFNAARVYSEQKDIPNALKYYQLALDIRPDSKEVKTNIELLFQGNGGGGNDSQKQQDQDQKDQKEQKEQQQQHPQQQQSQNNQQKKSQAPKPFKSEQLTDQDVRRILDELKRQEEQIRAKMNNQKSKETPSGKDW